MGNSRLEWINKEYGLLGSEEQKRGIVMPVWSTCYVTGGFLLTIFATYVSFDYGLSFGSWGGKGGLYSLH